MPRRKGEFSGKLLGPASAALATLGLGLLGAGCGCPPAQHQGSQVTISFVSPSDGTALHPSDNTNPNAPGGTIQITAQLTTAKASPGSPVTLTVDGNPGGTGTVGQGGKVSIANVSLTGSPSGTAHALQASVTDSGGAGSASASAHVTVILSAATCSVSIAPADGTIFNESGAPVGGKPTVKDEDPAKPGMQAKITADVSGCADGLQATLLAGTTQLATATVTGGSAVFDQVTLPDTPVTALSQPTQRLLVSVSVGSATSGASGSSQPVGYIVDSSQPTATIAQPANGQTIGDSQDVDPTTPGVQIIVAGTTTGLAAQIAAGIPVGFQIVNAQGAAYPTPLGNPHVNADGSFSVEVTLTNGSDSLAFQATTATGNLAQSAAVVVTSSAAPTLSILAPTTGELLNSLSDVDPNLPGLQTQLRFATTAQNGATITACSSVTPGSSAQPCPFAPGSFTVGSVGAAGNPTILEPVTLGEGDQTLVAQVTDPTGTASAAPVAISVHSLRPLVQSLAFSNDYVDADGGLWLNSAALTDGGAATTATVTLDPADTFFADGGAAQSVAIYDRIAQTSLGSAPISQQGASASAAVPLLFADGTHELEARVSDVWGNSNYSTQLTPVLTSPQADALLAVKTALPGCAFTGPTGSYWNIQDNNGAQTGSVTLPVSLSVTAGDALVAGATLPGSLALSLNGTSIGTDPVSSSTVQFAVDAGQGSQTLTASVTDPAGNPAQSCTPVGGLTIDVDTVAPTLAFTSPSSWTPAPTSGSSPPTFTSHDITVGLTTSVPNGQTVTVSVDAKVAGSGTVASGAAQVALTGIYNGTHSLTATVTDVAGNVGTAASVQISVQALGCGLSFFSPAGNPIFFNQQTGTKVILATDCPQGTSVQLTNTPQGGSAATATASVDTKGHATFPLLLSDGAQGTLTGQVTDSLGAVTTVGPIPYQVKLSPPQLSAATPASPVYVVAPAGNPLVGTSVSGVYYLASLNAYASPGNPYANATFQTTAAGLGPALGSSSTLGTAALHLAFTGQTTTDPASQTLTTDPETVTFTAVNLPPHASGTVTLTVTDNAGNATVQSWTVETDDIPPGPPSFTGTVTDERKATVKLAWSAPQDDNGSTVAYDLRWTTSAWSPTITDSQFFATTGVNQDPGVSSVNGTAVGTAISYSTTGLTPFNAWGISLRSVDAAGNRSEPISALTVYDNTIAGNPNQIWNQIPLSGPTGVDFGYRLMTGDFNGDGITDLTITAPVFGSTPGAAYVILGTSTPSSFSMTNATKVSDGTNSDYFGTDAAADSFLGATYSALAVGSPGWQSHQGRVDLFAGSGSGLATTPSIEIQGDPAALGWFGFTVKSIGDVDGDGLADLFIGAPGALSTYAQGDGYVFFSSSLKRATGNGCGSTSAAAVCLPIGKADLVFNGKTTTLENFGLRWGAFSAGGGFFVLPASGDNMVYGYQASTVLTSDATNNGGTATPIPTSQSAFQLTDGQGPVCGSATPPCGISFHAFGTAGFGGAFLTGNTTPDVVISSAENSPAVHIFQTSASGVSATSTVTLPEVVSNSDFGWDVTSADINQDGQTDVLVGTNSGSGGNYAYVYLNTGGTPRFSSSPSASVTTGQTYFGSSLRAGAFIQGTPVDLAVGAFGAGTVLLYY
ncbi:MAG: beta strand repeat-containing protein [Deltaproteobacteria bacterium]